MRQLRKFAHACHFDYFRRGKLRVQCVCGAQSPVFEDTLGEPYDTGELDDAGNMMIEFPELSKEEQGRAWCETHTGLVELHPQRRSSS